MAGGTHALSDDLAPLAAAVVDHDVKLDDVDGTVGQALVKATDDAADALAAETQAREQAIDQLATTTAAADDALAEMLDEVASDVATLYWMG